jgi:integrase
MRRKTPKISSSKIAEPVPLFPTYEELKILDEREYPALFAFIEQYDMAEHWHWAAEFLVYIGKNKSEHSYIRFRNDIERFLLWNALTINKALDALRKTDILDYIDFCVSPPSHWISHKLSDRFSYENGLMEINPQWRPFRVNHHKLIDNSKAKRTRPSQQTIISSFVGLNAFYRHLNEEEFCHSNPIPLAKRDCRHLIKKSQIATIHRLTDEQWQYVLDTAKQMASQDALFERNLFVVAAMKTLFLRVSELSERKDWLPMMSHFWQDDDNNWWFKAYGKGKKIRDITVPPDFIGYLKRYREWRGLPPLPFAGEQSVLVEKIRGFGGITGRQLTRLVQSVFDTAYDNMRKVRGDDAAQQLKEATTHYLRHTGASMEIERDRPLKDLSEDLGHASSATTDTVYVQVERRRRAASGRNRKVD